MRSLSERHAEIASRSEARSHSMLGQLREAIADLLDEPRFEDEFEGLLPGTSWTEQERDAWFLEHPRPTR